MKPPHPAFHIEDGALLLIPCPWCGLRDEIEFRWGGESQMTRPEEGSSDADWSDYLHFRANTKGVSFERWHHAYGCRRWFNIARDTTSHTILASYPMGAPRPGGLG
jgi:sarcosine oxidase subunit delta